MDEAFCGAGFSAHYTDRKPDKTSERKKNKTKNQEKKKVARIVSDKTPHESNCTADLENERAGGKFETSINNCQRTIRRRSVTLSTLLSVLLERLRSSCS